MAGLKKNVLVTGGTGFVGAHLVQRLIRENYSVIVPFRSFNPCSYFALEKLKQKVLLAQCDIKDRQRVFDVISKYEVEYIFHLAAQPLVTVAYLNPVETVATNIMGTVNILEAARQIKSIKGVLVASSDKAYGKNSNEYLETSPLQGDHPYEASKSAADLLSSAYSISYGVPVITIRCGNIYGPGDLNFSRIIPGIIKTALTGETLIIRSDGTFVRDYISVEDIVTAYLFLLKKLDVTKGQAYNVASEINMSVIELVKKARTILGKKIPFKVTNDQKNEIPYQHLSWSKIAQLGWKPHIALGAGLRKTFRWYQKYQKQLF